MANVRLTPEVEVPFEFFERSSSPTSIIREDGLVLMVNAAALEIVRRSGMHDYKAGCRLDAIEPRAFFGERFALLQRLVAEGSDAVVNDVIGGEQVSTHIRLLPEQSGTASPGATASLSAGGRVFLLMHHPGEAPVWPENAPRSRAPVYYEPEHQDLGPLALLSARELEVLALVGEGFTAAQIASRLFRSVETINTHRTALLRKLNCQNAVQLAALAHRAGLHHQTAGQPAD